MARLAEMITKSNNMTAFTGAGISTAAGIPDYRSGVHTIVETGPGTWEKTLTNNLVSQTDKDERIAKMHTQMSESTETAFPTRAHLALAELMNRGILKSIIT